MKNSHYKYLKYLYKKNQFGGNNITEEQCENIIEQRKKIYEDIYDVNGNVNNIHSRNLYLEDFRIFGKFVKENNIKLDFIIGSTNSTNGHFANDLRRFGGKKNTMMISLEPFNIFNCKPFAFYADINNRNIQNILETHFTQAFNNIYIDFSMVKLQTDNQFYLKLLNEGGKLYVPAEINLLVPTINEIQEKMKNNIQNKFYGLPPLIFEEIYRTIDYNFLDKLEKNELEKYMQNIKSKALKLCSKISTKLIFTEQKPWLDQNVILNDDSLNLPLNCNDKDLIYTICTLINNRMYDITKGDIIAGTQDYSEKPVYFTIYGENIPINIIELNDINSPEFKKIQIKIWNEHLNVLAQKEREKFEIKYNNAHRNIQTENPNFNVRIIKNYETFVPPRDENDVEMYIELTKK